MCFPVNFSNPSEKLFYRAPMNNYLSLLGKNLINFTINYDLAK